MRNGLSACCAHNGVTGTDESAQNVDPVERWSFNLSRSGVEPTGLLSLDHQRGALTFGPRLAPCLGCVSLRGWGWGVGGMGGRVSEELLELIVARYRPQRNVHYMERGEP